MDNSGFAQGTLAFAGYAILVPLALRLAPRAEPALVAVAGALAVCAAALPLLVCLSPGFNFWTYLVSYWFFATAFLMAFGAVYKSLSLRILAELLDKPGRSDSYDDIFSRYLVEDSYQNRLAVMRGNGLVRLEAGRYELTGKGRDYARRIQRIQLWFGITRSG